MSDNAAGITSSLELNHLRKLRILQSVAKYTVKAQPLLHQTGMLRHV